MDDHKRRTLALMRLACADIAPRDAGRHLVLIAHDYLEDGDLQLAREALREVPQQYLDAPFLDDLLEVDFGRRVAALFDEFGIDFEYARIRGAEA